MKVLMSMAIVASAIFSHETKAQVFESPSFRWNVVQLLMSKDVSDELGFTEEQAMEVREFYKKSNEKYTLAVIEMKNSHTNPESMANVNEVVKEIEKEMADVILPHQLERLRQIAAQQMLTQDKHSLGMLSKYIEKELKLTPEQKEEISKMSQDYEKGMSELVAKFENDILEKKNEHRESLLNLLTPEQKEYYDKTFGEIFSRYKLKKQTESKSKY